MDGKNVIILMIIITITMTGILTLFRKHISNYFMGQASNPHGIIGYIMTKIWNNSFISMTRWALDTIDITSSSIVLDVGCGGGKIISILSKKEEINKIYGIDISSKAVESSIRKNKRLISKGRVIIEKEDVHDLPYKRGFFDLVLAIQTHFYWEDLQLALEEIQYVLKDNGCFLLISEVHKMKYHMEEFEKKENLIEILKIAGFKEITIKQFNNWIEYICIK